MGSKSTVPIADVLIYHVVEKHLVPNYGSNREKATIQPTQTDSFGSGFVVVSVCNYLILAIPKRLTVVCQIELSQTEHTNIDLTHRSEDGLCSYGVEEATYSF